MRSWGEGYNLAVPDIQPHGCFVRVAVHVLRADMVPGAVQGKHEQHPEGFDAVRMHIPSNSYLVAMIDGIMLKCQAEINPRSVSVNR